MAAWKDSSTHQRIPATHVLLTACGVPDHKVTWPGALEHLPVICGAASGASLFQFRDDPQILIHLKHVDLNKPIRTGDIDLPVASLIAITIDSRSWVYTTPFTTTGFVA